MKRTRVVYVAGKFRGADHFEIAENIRAAERVGLDVWKAGAVALVPHANTAHFQGCLPDADWLDGDLELLSRCDALITVDNWRYSIGAIKEVAFAENAKMPVFHDVAELKTWLDSWPANGL